MPNAFTPNGDNKNDVFRVSPQIYIRLINFTVYNRRNQVVFKISECSKGWDDQIRNLPAPTGAYTYYIAMRSLDNWTNVTGDGAVTLIR